MVDHINIADKSSQADAFSHGVERRLSRLRALARASSFLGGLMLLVALVVGLGVSVVPRLMGLHTYAIISGSMEPSYPTGSLVYAAPASGDTLAAGDVAAFWRGEDVIVHRVQENVTAEGELITKGDANAEVDIRPVPYDQVLGKVSFSVPLVGYLMMALGSTSGTLTLGWYILMAVAFCLIGTIVGNLADRRQRETDGVLR